MSFGLEPIFGHAPMGPQTKFNAPKNSRPK